MQELLELRICEKNTDGEIRPTSDFLVWYYGFLIHEITESYGDKWEDEEVNEDEERQELVKDAVRNQIVTWTSQTRNGTTYAKLDTERHGDIVYDLINEIDERLMHVQSQKHGMKLK
jgi:hypothetical protein